ncbi:MAG: hypothetical protein FJ125_11530 [Deltaproteobacteria bacterium]|nr:hypothetical protein [Deltaproteobacteria bacterium]
MVHGDTVPAVRARALAAAARVAPDDPEVLAAAGAAATDPAAVVRKAAGQVRSAAPRLRWGG